jgi:hypothetical protein
MTNNELENLLTLARRTPGWNFREHPPQRAQLHGGCELIVMPPVLWRGFRCTARPTEPCELILLYRRAA